MTVLTSSAVLANCFDGETVNYKTTIEGDTANPKLSIEAQSLRGEAIKKYNRSNVHGLASLKQSHVGQQNPS